MGHRLIINLRWKYICCWTGGLKYKKSQYCRQFDGFCHTIIPQDIFIPRAFHTKMAIVIKTSAITCINKNWNDGNTKLMSTCASLLTNVSTGFHLLASFQLSLTLIEMVCETMPDSKPLDHQHNIQMCILFWFLSSTWKKNISSARSSKTRPLH